MQNGEYAGLPFPIEGIRISMSERHPRFGEIEGLWLGPREDQKPQSFTCGDDDIREYESVRNKFWSRRLKSVVWIVWHHQPGHPDFKVEAAYHKYNYYFEPIHRFNMLMDTLLVATHAWDMVPELKAQVKLFELLNETQVKTYVLTGSFVEKSKRSQTTYMFRKGRPTLVLHKHYEKMVPTCALCLHPLAYYQGTFAGGMVPTDDVIAHLLLMRADEYRFWKESNQHPVHRIEAGL